MQTKHPFLILLVILITVTVPTILTRDSRNLLIVWNVGQGQWVSLVEAVRCIHFDAGGEKMNWQSLIHQCSNKKNYLELSHWDFDHINFLAQLSRQFPICIDQMGDIRFANAKKKKLLKRIPRCNFQQSLDLRKDIWRWQPDNARSANGSSQVFMVNRFLIPGDSTKQQERAWSDAMSSADLKKIEILILGHHGSATSTSNLLLSRLSNLKIAIASARNAKYGHPHKKIRAALRSSGVALLLTEDWGNIAFEL